MLFAYLFRRISGRRLPTRIGPTVAPQLFARWNSITDLRIAQNGRALASDDPASREYFGIAPRNVRRARVNLTVEKDCGPMGSESEPRDFAGYITKEPPDGEVLLQLSEKSLLTRQSFPVLDTECNKAPGPSTPTRNAPGAPPAEPDPKSHRVDISSFSPSDREFPNRHAVSPPAL